MLLAAYLMHALHSGHVYARSGLFGRDLSRDAEPWRLLVGGGWRTRCSAAALLFIF